MKRFQSILAAALAGCLLMAFTACSSGNNANITTNPSTGVNTSERSDAGEESVTAKLEANAEGEEGQSLISSLESSSGNTATGSLEVEGNTLVVICTYQIDIPEETMDAVCDALDSGLESMESTFQPVVSQLSDQLGDEVELRVEYHTMDGDMLASHTYTAD